MITETRLIKIDDANIGIEKFLLLENHVLFGKHWTFVFESNCHGEKISSLGKDAFTAFAGTVEKCEIAYRSLFLTTRIWRSKHEDINL